MVKNNVNWRVEVLNYNSKYVSIAEAGKRNAVLVIL